MMRPVAHTLLAMTILLGGCAASTQRTVSPYETPGEVDRNTRRAEELTRRAAGLLPAKPKEAEALLRQALAADLYHGPAHNNLGVAMLLQDRTYEAAHEFEWARKLLPGHPDPRVNLALVFESAGRIDKALEFYETALEVYPNHLPAIMGIVRLQVRHAREDDRTEEYLEEIAMRAEDESWRKLARRLLATRVAPEGG